MKTMLKPGAANLIAGTYGNHQATLGVELMFRHLQSGGVAVALVETSGDAGVLRERGSRWLKARACDQEAIKRLACVTDYRAHHEPVKLANAIKEVATGVPLLVWCDISGGPYVAPDSHWLTRAANLLDHLPGATVLSVISTGPDGMPVPPLTQFPADVVYRVHAKAMSLVVTPIKPSGPTIQLVGKIGAGGAILIDPQEETENV